MISNKVSTEIMLLAKCLIVHFLRVVETSLPVYGAWTPVVKYVIDLKQKMYKLSFIKWHCLVRPLWVFGDTVEMFT